MTKIIVSFGSEREAQAAVNRLSQANVGEVRARVLNGSETGESAENGLASTIITPELGSIQVRPTDEAQAAPDTAGHTESSDTASGIVPPTGGRAGDIQVMIEVDDQYENQVRQILKDQ